MTSVLPVALVFVSVDGRDATIIADWDNTEVDTKFESVPVLPSLKEC